MSESLPAASEPFTSHARITPPGIRWWPAVLILVAASCVIAGIWQLPLGGDSRQPKVMNSIAVGLLTGASLITWLLFAARLALRARLVVAATVVLGIGGLCAMFTIDGVTGDVMPRIVLRSSHRGRRPVVDLLTANVEVDLKQTTANDYPQFLGMNWRATIDNVRLDPDWEAHPPKLLWKRPIGEGWGSFAIVGAYAVSHEQHGSDEQITCYEVATGKLMWRYGYPAEYRKVIAGDGPRDTPTVVDGRVYAMGATGILTCLDGRRGERIWSADVLKDAQAVNVEWGKSCSPLVLGDNVVVSAGGYHGWSLVAYNKDDGHIAWHAGDEPSAYASPMLANLGGVLQILILSTRALVAHDPNDGHELWQTPWGGSGTNNIAQPIVVGNDRLFLSSGNGFGCVLVEVTREASGKYAIKPVWKQNKNLKLKFTNGVLRDGYIYGLDDGVLCCLDLATGRRRWKAGRYGHGQILLVGDLLVVQAEAGELYLVRARPDQHEELGTAPGLASQTWNNPVLSGSRLLIRNDREAACFELPLLEELAN